MSWVRGGAGLTAAILAHDQGARTVIIERTDKIGGTTAVSGGVLWVPLNHRMEEMGFTDSREEALAYCRRITSGSCEDELIETFVDTSHVMLQYIEKTVNTEFTLVNWPDYHPEEKGAKLTGRSLEPQLFTKSMLGGWSSRLRKAPLTFLPITFQDFFYTYRAVHNPRKLPVELIGERMDQGLVAQGNALIAHLLKACLDRDIKIDLETRALELISSNGRVIGLRTKKGGKDYLVKARGGVILACGGFEWNERLKTHYLAGTITYPHSPPFNEGDGLIMAAELGADLANTSEAWWYPSVIVPGEEYEGRPLSRMMFSERICPHTILVNRYGQRFVNEAAAYNDMMKAFFYFDPNAYGYRNLPCWAVLDGQYREKYFLNTVMPGDPDPDWLIRDDTLQGLARKAGIDAEGLEVTVTRFNGFVKEGKDRDFGKGSSAYDRLNGDLDAPHPNFGTIEKPPFYALPVYPGAIGTKGGPRTNSRGQVLNVRGKIIPGLYAAGNVMAGISGPGYYGGGSTISIAMTYGYICGINAARESQSDS